MENKNVKCTSCGNEFKGNSKLSLLAFKKYKCTKCGEISLYPLGRSYKILYWFFILITLGPAVQIIREGGIPLPGVITIIAIIALIKNYRLNNKL